jgi:AcrR family transcriptional regulator
MTDDVKPRRRYQSTVRAQQTAETRRHVVATAGALFRDLGYVGVTMPVIASEAGVGVETIYRAFGSKAGLFKSVIDAVVAGGTVRAEVQVEDRPAIRAVIDEPDPRRQVERYAATQPGIHRRSGPLLRALAGAAATDPELRALWDDIEGSRLTGQGRFVAMLAERGSLRPGLTVDDGRDGLWTLCSLAVHDQLVVARGWSADRYRAWLAERLVDLLLAD